MTYLAKPKLHHPTLPQNKLGFTRRDYEGKISTLCAGCGHDSISAALIQACWELEIEPHRVAKLSGIGCSSKTPDYFLGNSHGFNTVHGRMPSVLTGANLANRELLYLGVSGDGDSASIGLGQFAHAMRRGVNMTYIVENNGVYGLTKGQFSATADQGSKSKKGVVNTDSAIDLVSLGLQLGATYVARSFSGDKEQLVPLIKGALTHRGAALIDVISPCVAFNNHAGSTKSYDFVREHNESVNRLDFMPQHAEITADYAPGSLREVRQHEGSILRLRKLHENYDPRDRIAAMDYLQRRHADGEIVTGLLYLDPDAGDLHAALNTVETPLNKLGAKELIWHDIAEMSWRIDAAELLTYRAAKLYDAGVAPRDLMKAAAMAKLVATETATFCADRTVQILGGDGLTKEYGRAEQIYRDARALPIVGGTSEIARYLIATADLPAIKLGL
jgi:2-oxoglutarate ferredoxin oxidoreductase subunit beta